MGDFSLVCIAISKGQRTDHIHQQPYLIFTPAQALYPQSTTKNIPFWRGAQQPLCTSHVKQSWGEENVSNWNHSMNLNRQNIINPTEVWPGHLGSHPCFDLKSAWWGCIEHGRSSPQFHVSWERTWCTVGDAGPLVASSNVSYSLSKQSFASEIFTQIFSLTLPNIYRVKREAQQHHSNRKLTWTSVCLVTA